MPVREVTIDGQRGYRWGDAGAFYPYTEGDPKSEAAARAKAELQGEVIQRRRAAASGGARGRQAGARPARQPAA